MNKHITIILGGVICVMVVSYLIFAAGNDSSRLAKYVDFNTALDNQGDFILPEGYLIHISDRNGFVSYDLFDGNNNSLINSSNSFRSVQSWFFVWGRNHALWVYSGDIGTKVWMTAANGHYEESNLTALLCQQSPTEFKNDLPRSTKLRFDCGV